MKKFRIGDKVKRIKGVYKNMRVGDIDQVVGINKYNSLTLRKYGDGHDPGSFELVEDEFQYGDEVEVRDSDVECWRKRTFIHYNPDKESRFKYIVTPQVGELFPAYEQCRKVEKPKEYTLQEIADKLDIPVKELRIKD